MTSPIGRNLFHFDPPYMSLEPVDLRRPASFGIPRGRSVVWYLRSALRQNEEQDWLASRPLALPLISVLPPADLIEPAIPLLRSLESLKPRAVVPDGELVSPRSLKKLLAIGPQPPGEAVVNYLADRGVEMSAATRGYAIRIFELAPTTPSVTLLSRRLHTSRRTIGRRFAREGLPVPSHWLGLARLILALAKLQQDESATVFRVACRFGYPDGFTMSNQMKRLLGYRPSELRQWLGWEWLVEQWWLRELGSDYRQT